MNTELTNEVLALLPSEALRRAIRERGTVFTERELVRIAFDYAPDYETRLALLERIGGEVPGELGELVRQMTARQRACLAEFLKPEENAVYELHIKTEPDAYDERYLCASYEAARRMIPLFYREYDCEVTDAAVYRIKKRKIFCGKEGEPFSEDYLASAVLLSDGRLYSVDAEGIDLCRGDGRCAECSLLCIEQPDVAFPRVLERRDIVKFRENPLGAEQIGIIPYFCEGDTENEYYVIPLDCEFVRHHDFGMEFWDHAHIPAPLARKIAPEELNEKMRADALALMEYIKNMEDTQ